MSASSADPMLVTTLPPFPYPGLRPFETNEWRIFFGRESMINEIIERMAGQHLVFIHGSSGSGKSSLIRAGVLPKLAQLHDLHGSSWLSCTMRPSGSPLWNLAAEFARLQGMDGNITQIGDIIRLFNRRDATLSAVVNELPGLEGKRLCVLVDQFEELFRFEQETSREEAELFIDLLIREIPEDTGSGDADDTDSRTAISERPGGNVQIIVTMRSEFLGDCARFDRFAEAINRAQYLVPRLTRTALIRAIRMPARLYSGEVEIELAERMIAEVRGKPDELPLIQHGLMFFWNEAVKANPGEKVILDQQMLDQAGSLRELISIHADHVMQTVAVDPHRAAAVQRLLRAITDVNSEGQAIRRPQMFRNLVELCGVPEADLHEIVDAFRAEGVSFLTPYFPAQISGDTDIDISHEALIRYWEALGGWMRAEASAAEKYRELRMQAELKHPLLSGDILRAALAWQKDQNPTEAWARRYNGNTTSGFGKTMQFLAASESRWKRQMATRQRILRGKAIISNAGVVVFVTVVVLVVAWIAYGRGFYEGYTNGRADSYFAGGNGTQRDYAKALNWYQIADYFGNTHAEDRIAAIYETGGFGVPQSDKSAVFWYEKAANRGAVDAEVQLGMHYLTGENVAKDYGKAKDWFNKAAAAGAADAELNIGLLYLNGEGGPQDFRQAMKWFQKAADAGSAAAMKQIGLLHLNGEGVQQDDNQAVRWFRISSREGPADAEFDIAMLYSKGQGVKQDYTHAMSWFRRAATDGSAGAELKIGLLYFLGLGVHQDNGQALNWIQKAVNDGSAEAESFLAFLYLNGQGVPQDFGKAMSWFARAAIDGANDADDDEYQIGLRYFSGEGVPQDYGQARNWFQKAAADGSADAEDALGELYVNGQGVKKDYGHAMALFQNAAAAGSAEAEYDIGGLYEYGQGVAQDYGRAMQWYQKAAQGGSADAENAIGMLYVSGEGVPTDYDEGMKWLKKAAAAGSVDAEYHIGVRYLNGDGVKQDYSQALTWFEKAAAAGSAKAEYAIGNLYKNGQGIAQDYCQAMAWYQKAVAGGADAAGDAEFQIGIFYLYGQCVAPDKTNALSAFGRALTLEQAKLASDPGDESTMVNLAWYFIVNDESQKALETSNQAMKLAPNDLLNEVNMADALMMLGQTDAARKIYLQYQDEQDAGNGDSWKANVLSDFDTLNKLGHIYPLMDEIRKAFGV